MSPFVWHFDTDVEDTNAQTDPYKSWFPFLFLMGVGSSATDFSPNITIIALAVLSFFPFVWYCDSRCDAEDNVPLIGHLILHMVLFLWFSQDTTKYVPSVTFLSLHLFIWLYLTSDISSAHNSVCRLDCGTNLYRVQMGTPEFLLSGNPGMNAVMLLTRSPGSRVKGQPPH